MLGMDTLQAIIDFVQSNYDQPWGMVVKLFDFLSCNYNVTLVKIPKTMNMVTYKLAKTHFVWAKILFR